MDSGKCLHKVCSLKQHTMESVMYANTVHNNAADWDCTNNQRTGCEARWCLHCRRTLPVKSCALSPWTQRARRQQDKKKTKKRKAQREAIRIFNIHNCSVCSVPEGSSLITQSHVISRGITAHQGQTASCCGERQLDTGPPVWLLQPVRPFHWALT